MNKLYQWNFIANHWGDRLPTDLQHLIIERLKNVSDNELMYYSERYGFSLTIDECQNISHYLNHLTLNPFIKADREKMFHDLTDLTNEQTAIKAKQLFKQLINQYGMSHLFTE